MRRRSTSRPAVLTPPVPIRQLEVVDHTTGIAFESIEMPETLLGGWPEITSHALELLTQSSSSQRTATLRIPF